MIQFCVQMEINGSPEQVWERLILDFPPEYRRPGKVDMATIGTARSRPNFASFPDMEILEWREGGAFSIQFSKKPYLKSLIADAWLQDNGRWEGPTLLNLRLALQTGWLLTIPIRILFWLFRNRIRSLVLQSLAGLRYEIETGQHLELNAEFKLPLDGIEIAPCS